MTAKRKIEVFSAGCSVCRETIEMVKRNACQSCEVTVLDMNATHVADRAKQLGVRLFQRLLLMVNLQTVVLDVAPMKQL